jgi:hypothetical protein
VGLLHITLLSVILSVYGVLQVAVALLIVFCVDVMLDDWFTVFVTN